MAKNNSNNYQNFVNLVQTREKWEQVMQETYRASNPSLEAKSLSASLYNGEDAESQRLKTHLLGNSNSKEVVSALNHGVEGIQGEIESQIKNNLEGIISDAPRELVSFAAENIAPSKYGNGKYGLILKYHEKYRKASELKQDYFNAKKKVKARGEILKQTGKAIEKRYSGDRETASLLKDLNFASDQFLMGDYEKIVEQNKKEFMGKLKNNEAGYLFSNVNNLKKKEDFISYLITGDKKHLVKQASETKDKVGTGIMIEGIREEEIAQASSPAEAKRLMQLRNYEASQGYGEGEFAISRGPGMQTNASQIPMRSAY